MRVNVGALEKIKAAIRKTYDTKGEAVVRANCAAVDATLQRLQQVPVPAGAPSEAGASPIDEGDDDEDDSDDQLPEPSAPAIEAQVPEPQTVAAAAAAQDRPSFSLFSWLRREPEDKKD